MTTITIPFLPGYRDINKHKSISNFHDMVFVEDDHKYICKHSQFLNEGIYKLTFYKICTESENESCEVNSKYICYVVRKDMFDEDKIGIYVHTMLNTSIKVDENVNSFMKHDTMHYYHFYTTTKLKPIILHNHRFFTNDILQKSILQDLYYKLNLLKHLHSKSLSYNNLGIMQLSYNTNLTNNTKDIIPIPEFLLNQKYNKEALDVWNLGIDFLNLMTSQYSFSLNESQTSKLTIHDYINQIHTLLGEPSEKFLKNISKTHKPIRVGNIYTFIKTNTPEDIIEDEIQDILNIQEDMSKDCISPLSQIEMKCVYDLFSKMLTWDPKDRATPSELIQLDIFKDMEPVKISDNDIECVREIKRDGTTKVLYGMEGIHT